MAHPQSAAALGGPGGYVVTLWRFIICLTGLVLTPMLPAMAVEPSPEEYAIYRYLLTSYDLGHEGCPCIVLSETKDGAGSGVHEAALLEKQFASMGTPLDPKDN